MDDVKNQELYLVGIKISDRGPNADERTRTSTRLLPQRPERCASTNSATSALELRILLIEIEGVKRPTDA